MARVQPFHAEVTCPAAERRSFLGQFGVQSVSAEVEWVHLSLEEGSILYCRFPTALATWQCWAAFPEFPLFLIRGKCCLPSPKHCLLRETIAESERAGVEGC